MSADPAEARPPGRAVAGACAQLIVVLLALASGAADLTLPFVLIGPLRAAFPTGGADIALLTAAPIPIGLAVCALPLSGIADRLGRGRFIAASVAVWSAATAACALAPSAGVFLALRAVAGVGEAGLQPAAYALLADLFSARVLPRALAAGTVSALAGRALTLSFGGLLYAAFRSGAAGRALEGAAAWRPTLGAFAALGLVLAPAAFVLLRDPDGRGEAAAASEGASLRAHLRQSAFFFAPLLAALTAAVLCDSGRAALAAPFFTGAYGWSLAGAEAGLGIMALVTGVLGAPLGVLVNAFVRNLMGREAPAAAMAGLACASVPMVILAPLSPTGGLALLGFGVVSLAGAAAGVLAPAALAGGAPPGLRARTLAVSNLACVLGAALGPWAYGAFTLAFTARAGQGPGGPAVTLAVLSAGLVSLGVPLLFYADRRYPVVTALASRARGAP